jgi:hypothetical protein
MTQFVERLAEIKAGVERAIQQITMEPVQDDNWDFCLTREQLENLLQEISKEDGIEGDD